MSGLEQLVRPFLQNSPKGPHVEELNSYDEDRQFQDMFDYGSVNSFDPNFRSKKSLPPPQSKSAPIRIDLDQQVRTEHAAKRSHAAAFPAVSPSASKATTQPQSKKSRPNVGDIDYSQPQFEQRPTSFQPKSLPAPSSSKSTSTPTPVQVSEGELPICCAIPPCGVMVRCSVCGDLYHASCLSPSVFDSDDFRCSNCQS